MHTWKYIYECIVAHTRMSQFTWCGVAKPTPWIHAYAYMNQSCHTYESRHTHTNEVRHMMCKYTSVADSVADACIYAYMHEACHTCKWVMSHSRMSHVTWHADVTWLIHISIVGFVKDAFFACTHMNAACHTCKWVMSHANGWDLSHETQICMRSAKTIGMCAYVY